MRPTEIAVHCYACGNTFPELDDVTVPWCPFCEGDALLHPVVSCIQEGPETVWSRDWVRDWLPAPFDPVEYERWAAHVYWLQRDDVTVDRVRLPVVQVPLDPLLAGTTPQKAEPS